MGSGNSELFSLQSQFSGQPQAQKEPKRVDTPRIFASPRLSVLGNVGEQALCCKGAHSSMSECAAVGLYVTSGGSSFGMVRTESPHIRRSSSAPVAIAGRRLSCQ